jgi:predicted outer membrane protein
MKIGQCALLALSATLFACDEQDATMLESREDELGSVDAGAWSDGGTKEGKHKDWAAAASCLSPRLKDCADGQIAAIVTAANLGEVALSKALLPKLQTESARALAEQLIAEHGKAQTKLDSLLREAGIAPIENANSEHLTEMNELTQKHLATKTGVALEGSYVSHQVATHAQVLGTLDHVLLPSVKHPELKKYLQEVRKEVGGHTETIAKVQTELQGPCGGNAGDAGVPRDGGVSIVDGGTWPDGGRGTPPTPVLGTTRQ